jgi:hypothetical protein
VVVVVERGDLVTMFNFRSLLLLLLLVILWCNRMRATRWWWWSAVTWSWCSTSAHCFCSMLLLGDLAEMIR